MTSSTRINFIYLILLLIISLQCNSNQNEKKSVEPYSLTVVISENLDLKSGAPMNEGFKLLFNYYTDSITVFAPIIRFERVDTSWSMEGFTVPLSSLNTWRKNIDMLSTVNFLEDYDESLKQLTIPSILAYETQNSAGYNEVSKYRNDSILYVGDSLALQVERLRKSMKNGKDITVVLKRNKIHPATTIHPPGTVGIVPVIKDKTQEESNSAKEPFIINCSDQNSRNFLSWTDIGASYYKIIIKDMDTGEIMYETTITGYTLDVINIANLIGSRQYELKVVAKRKSGHTISSAQKAFSLTENKEMIQPSCCK